MTIINRVAGIKIGHSHDAEALTGCTVILCEQGAVPGIDKRGGGTTTRQADAFEPWHVVQRVHGVLLTGGSAHGLGALSGMLRYLEERQVGFDMRVARVPIAAAAGLFDLGIGSATVRPDDAMAYDACRNASSAWPEEGCVGAGMGATVGKLLGMGQAMKSGLGVAALSVGSQLVVEAVAAVNAGGDIIDPGGGGIVAGVRRQTDDEGSGYFADALEVLAHMSSTAEVAGDGQNTVIGAIITNARLTKTEATKVAQMAQDGLARTVKPSHTMFDGDTIFTLATGEVTSDVSLVGAFAAEAFQEAVIRAVSRAVSMGGLPAATDANPDKWLISE